MKTRVSFSQITNFIGRSGMGKCSGVDFFKHDGNVLVTPLTSAGSLANCEIRVPLKDVEQMVRILAKMAGLKTCAYVRAIDLVPRAWGDWFWATISERAPFSWGDNNHSLVSACDFANHCEERLEAGNGVTQSAITRFLNKIRALGDTYIDLEN